MCILHTSFISFFSNLISHIFYKSIDPGKSQGKKVVFHPEFKTHILENPDAHIFKD